MRGRERAVLGGWGRAVRGGGGGEGQCEGVGEDSVRGWRRGVIRCVVCCGVGLSLLQNAFHNGEWGKMSARDRGRIMYK